MLPTVQIGPLSLQVPGLVLLAGLWVGLALAERSAKSRSLDPGNLYTSVMVALIAGLIGARLGYVAAYPAAFSRSPLSFFSLNLGILDPFSGAACALAAGLVFIHRKRMPIWLTLDALTPLLATMAVAIRLSHLASGAAFGSPTDLPWAVYQWGAARHPAQIYETLFALVIWAVVFRAERSGIPGNPGVLFISFIAASAASRLFLEAFRGDSQVLAGGIRSAQLVAWIVLAASLWVLSTRISAARQTTSGVDCPPSDDTHT